MLEEWNKIGDIDFYTATVNTDNNRVAYIYGLSDGEINIDWKGARGNPHQAFTFKTREQIDELISALEKARDRAFGRN
jgi:hypothetical protein